jgi:hypothetical protein
MRVNISKILFFVFSVFNLHNKVKYFTGTISGTGTTLLISKKLRHSRTHNACCKATAGITFIYFFNHDHLLYIEKNIFLQKKDYRSN